MNDQQILDASSRPPALTRFRTADGSLTDKRNRLSRILKHLIQNTTVDSAGGVQTNDFADFKWRPLLVSAFAVLLPEGVELNPWDTESIVWDAFISLRRTSSDFDVDCWAIECDRITSRLLAAGPRTYTIYTTVSLREDTQHWLVGLPYSHEVISAGPSAFPHPPCIKTPGAKSDFDRLSSLKYLAIALQIPAISAHEAVHRAINALAVWRSLMSLYADPTYWRMTFSGGHRTPLTAIDSGPFYLAAEHDGAPVDQYWHETPSTEQRQLFTSKEEPHRHKLLADAAGKILGLPYRAALTALLIRYADSVCHMDYSMAVLGLWGILESLVGGRSGDHKIMTKRAVALDKRGYEQDFAYEVLDLVRVSRNCLVHAGRRPHSEEQIAYLLKPVVDRHLRYLIRNPLGYSSLEDHRREMARNSGTESAKNASGCDCPGK